MLCAFQSRKDIFSVVIPNSVTEIGDFAFDNSGLSIVVIPDSVRKIGNYAFFGCTNLVRIASREEEIITHTARPWSLARQEYSQGR